MFRSRSRRGSRKAGKKAAKKFSKSRLAKKSAKRAKAAKKKPSGFVVARRKPAPRLARAQRRKRVMKRKSRVHRQRPSGRAVAAAQVGPPAKPKTFRLVVQTNSDTELLVMDSSLALLRRSVGPLDISLPYGLYKVRAVRGGGSREQLVELDRNLPPLSLWVHSFPAIAPIGPMLGTFVPQVEAVAAAALGRGAAAPARRREGVLFLAHRDAPTQGTPAAKSSPLAGIRLLPWKAGDAPGRGSKAFGPLEGSTRSIDGVEWSAAWRDVEPGSYAIEYEDDGRAVRQAILVAPGWQTRVFVYRRPGDTQSGPRVDLSIQMARPDSNIVYYDHYETIEIARNALEARRPIFATWDLIEQLLYGKFDNPIAGIVGLHLFLGALEQARAVRDGPAREGKVPITLDARALDRADHTIDEVLNNLSKLLGAKENEPISDLVALQVRAGRQPAKNPVSLTAPPMFWAGWEVLRRSTGAGQPVDIDFPLWAQIALSAPCGPYFGWQSSGDSNALLTRFDFSTPRRGGRLPALEKFGVFEAVASAVDFGSRRGGEFAGLTPLDDQETAVALGIPLSVLGSLKQIS
jgi:hypothetical protein